MEDTLPRHHQNVSPPTAAGPWASVVAEVHHYEAGVTGMDGGPRLPVKGRSLHVCFFAARVYTGSTKSALL